MTHTSEMEIKIADKSTAQVEMSCDLNTLCPDDILIFFKTSAIGNIKSVSLRHIMDEVTTPDDPDVQLLRDSMYRENDDEYADGFITSVKVAGMSEIEISEI